MGARLLVPHNMSAPEQVNSFEATPQVHVVEKHHTTKLVARSCHRHLITENLTNQRVLTVLVNPVLAMWSAE